MNEVHDLWMVHDAQLLGFGENHGTENSVVQSREKLLSKFLDG